MGDELKSFKNFPDEIWRQTKINVFQSAFGSAYECNVSSLEGIPSKIMGDEGNLNLLRMPKLNLSHIDKYVDIPERAGISLSYEYKGPLLSFLKMKRTPRILNASIGPGQNTRVRDALQIIKSHFKNRDILACQEELIEAGQKEFARL